MSEKGLGWVARELSAIERCAAGRGTPACDALAGRVAGVRTAVEALRTGVGACQLGCEFDTCEEPGAVGCGLSGMTEAAA